MRRQRWMMLALVSFVIIALTVLSSASWFIIFRKNQNVDFIHVDPDTSPYFTTGGTYSGVSQSPTLTDLGKAIYGDNIEDFEIVWKSGVQSDEKTAFSSNEEQKHAGKHYYSIVHTKTGQVICNNHEVVITKATLTSADVPLNGYYRPGETVLSEGRRVSWTGVNSESFSATVLVGEKAPVFGESETLVYPVEKPVTTSVISDAWMHNDYQESSLKVTYKVVSTCYSYAEGKATYYSDLDSALTKTEGATVATKLVAMQSFIHDGYTFTADPNATETGILKKMTHEINGDKVVGTNVILIIPYKMTEAFDATGERVVRTDRFATSSTTTDNDGTTEPSRFSVTPKCVNEVTVVGGTLDNKGRIEIAGITGYTYPDSGASAGATVPQGSTTGNHATVTLKNATIKMETGSPEIELHGYIANGGNGKVLAKTGLITMPFVIYDYGGGTETVALFKGSGNALSLVGSDRVNVAPFSTFDMPNIQAELTCHGGAGGATVRGMASLYTSTLKLEFLGATLVDIPAKYNAAEFNVFGDAGALFNMTDGKAVFQYNSENNASYAYNTANYKLHRNATTKITLDGTTSSGDIMMSLDVGLGVTDVSLAQVKLPVSDKIKLHLTGDHVYTFTTPYKFLPGSEMYIQSGANVLVESNSGLMFYQSLNASSDGAVLYKEYYNKTAASTPAVCQIENGSLTVKGSLGGTITAKGANNLLNLSRTTTEKLTMTETEGTGDRDGLNFVFTTNQTVEQTANGIIAGTSANFGNKGYYSTNGSSSTGFVWKEATSDTDVSGSVTLNGGEGDVIGGDGKFNSNGSTSLEAENLFYNPETGKLLTPPSLLEKPVLADQEFVGWYLDANCSTKADESNITSSAQVQLYAKWKYSPQVSIKVYDHNDTTGTTMSGVYVNGYFTVPQTTVNDSNAQYKWYLIDWTLTITDGNGNVIEPIEHIAPGSVLSLKEILNLEDNWEHEDAAMVSKVKGYTIELTPYGSEDMYEINITSTGWGTLYGSFVSGELSVGKYYVRPGQLVSITYSVNLTEKRTTLTIRENGKELVNSTEDKGYVGVVNGDWTVNVKSECIAAGTMITLADGTQKKVEDLVESDILLVFDHETGQYVECPILFIERDGWKEYTLINLTFSNGTTTRLIYEHGLFDLTLNRYVYITEQNYSEFVGHEFAVMSADGYETVTLTDAFLTTEYTGCYSLVTVYHFNYFIDGLFSMPGGIEGLFNFFEYDESLKFDAEQMAADIEKYGLYTYEDFAPYMPEEIFNLFQAPYYKVAVEKGMITFEEIVALIERYLVQHGIV